MEFRLTMLQCFNFLSFCMKVLGIHPPIEDNIYFSNTSYYLWWFYLINYIVLLVLTIYTRCTIDSDQITKWYSMMEISLLLESITVLVHFKVQEIPIKNLLSITRNQVQCRSISVYLNNNMNVTISIFMFILYFTIAYMYMNKPELKINGKLMMTVIYPFSMNSLLIKVLCYCNQIITIMHFFAIIVVEWMCALIMYVCAWKLSILKNNWANFKDEIEFKDCLQKHIDILSCMNNINEVVRIVAMKTVISFMCLSICSGLQLIVNDTWTKEFAIPVLILKMVYLRIVLCAENAEILTTINDEIQSMMYFSSWYEEKRKLLVGRMIVIEQCRNVPKIHINGFMPALNRKYLLTILYATFSYFMALRTIFAI